MKLKYITLALIFGCGLSSLSVMADYEEPEIVEENETEEYEVPGDAVAGAVEDAADIAGGAVEGAENIVSRIL